MCKYSFPDSLGDDLILEVFDLKGKLHGRVIAQLASIAEDPVRISSHISLRGTYSIVLLNFPHLAE